MLLHTYLCLSSRQRQLCTCVREHLVILIVFKFTAFQLTYFFVVCETHPLPPFFPFFGSMRTSSIGFSCTPILHITSHLTYPHTSNRKSARWRGCGGYDGDVSFGPTLRLGLFKDIELHAPGRVPLVQRVCLSVSPCRLDCVDHVQACREEATLIPQEITINNPLSTLLSCTLMIQVTLLNC